MEELPEAVDSTVDPGPCDLDPGDSTVDPGPCDLWATKAKPAAQITARTMTPATRMSSGFLRLRWRDGGIAWG
jgi:hypothetical protein